MKVSYVRCLAVCLLLLDGPSARALNCLTCDPGPGAPPPGGGGGTPVPSIVHNYGARIEANTEMPGGRFPSPQGYYTSWMIAPYGSYPSLGGYYGFVLQDDCNLVHYRRSSILSPTLTFTGWATNTRDPEHACWLIMTGDGNLVLKIYNPTDCGNFFNQLFGYCPPGFYEKWSSDTGGNPGAHLDIQTDGNVVIRATNGTVLWSMWYGRAY